MESVQQEIAPEYRSLVTAVREKVPAGMDLMTAHQCRYHGRRFIHLAFRGRGQLLSLVIARKNQGESFDVEGVAPAMSAAGVPLYGAGVQRFQIAAVETGDYLVYTISDMSRQRNMEIMAAVAPGVVEFLNRLG
jgi:hypothetical protein